MRIQFVTASDLLSFVQFKMHIFVKSWQIYFRTSFALQSQTYADLCPYFALPERDVDTRTWIFSLLQDSAGFERRTLQIRLFIGCLVHFWLIYY